MLQHPTNQGAPQHQAIPGTTGTPVFVAMDNQKRETLFAKKAAKDVSVVQITLGIASFLAEIPLILMILYNSTSDSDIINYASGIGVGIHCSVFFIISGGLGIAASRNPTFCKISAFMALSIIAPVFGGIQIIVTYYNYRLATVNDGWRRHSEPRTAILSLMVLAGAVEMIVSIICAAICCRACCCQGNGSSTGRVVYLAQGENGSGAVPVQMTGGLHVQLANGVPVPVQMPNGVPIQMANGVPVQMAADVPFQMAGGVPVQMARGVPVQMAGGVSVQMAGGVSVQMAGGVPVQKAGDVPIQMAGDVPIQMAGDVPIQMAGGVPVQMAYLPQTTPVTGVLDQTLNELPSFEDVVRGDEQETKEEYGKGGYTKYISMLVDALCST